MHFNSIKVQLEHSVHRPNSPNDFDFNSIKVQLEPAHHHYSLSSFLFQFHKGTIRTNDDFPVFRVEEFQFHKGTIRTIAYV